MFGRILITLKELDRTFVFYRKKKQIENRKKVNCKAVL